MTISEELQLVNRAKSDVHAFNALYEYYINRIYQFCLQRVLVKEIAEDITSQVFIDSIKAIANFDTTQGIRFGSWLYKVAHNKIVDHFRKNKLQTVSLDADVVNNIQDVNYNVESEVRIQTKIARVMLELKKDYQLIISLKFFSELEIGEIAEVLNKKPTVVSVKLHRALESFRKNFIKIYGESEIFDLF
jgi:RNA polymerase sigma-70 factor (ECF subfamily)